MKVADTIKKYFENFCCGDVLSKKEFVATIKMIESGFWSLQTAFNFIRICVSYKKHSNDFEIAWCSPLPPQKTGVGYFFSQTCLPFLDKHSDLVVVNNNCEWDSNYFDIKIGTKEFLIESRDKWVILNIGNNDFHTWMHEVPRNNKTIAIIHDVFIGNQIFNALNKDHDLLYDLATKEGCDLNYGSSTKDIIIKHPFIMSAIKDARAVVVHSKYAAELIEAASYGHFKRHSNIFVTKLPRQSQLLPDGRIRRIRKLSNEIKITSFGNVAEHKMSLELLQGFLASHAFKEREAILIFAGECYFDEYHASMMNLIRENGAEDYVIFTGYVDQKTYKQIALDSTIAIQLRMTSRGESSGALSDCYSFLIPTIINSHGTFIEQDPCEVFLLSERPQIEEIANAIDILSTNEKIRIMMVNRMYRNNLLFGPDRYVNFLIDLIRQIKN